MVSEEEKNICTTSFSFFLLWWRYTVSYFAQGIILKKIIFQDFFTGYTGNIIQTLYIFGVGRRTFNSLYFDV
jgi:hypothetical protein